tara:strand:- start:129 stop:542 length:414 start_codon:yes stop_codon:yes gene_type:complete
MEVNRFNKETDYEEICSWWKSWGMPIHAKEVLSETGIIISKDGVNICSSFIYSTDSYICFFEFAVINKNTTKEQREGALEKLGDTLLLTAKEMGFKLAMTLGEEKHARTAPVLHQWKNKNMGDVVVKNMSQYWKILT